MILFGALLPWSSGGVSHLLSVLPESAQAAGDPIIAAAGDIACDPASSSFNSGNGTSGACRQRYTSDLLVNGGYSAVLPLGDNQYYCGSYSAFLQSYDPTWGRLKSITHPSVGNHEYLTNGGSSPSTGCDSTNTNAAGYYRYFGSAAGAQGSGYYSFDVGSWHLIALNSSCSSAGGCGSTSPQGTWLKNDLATHANFCTLAYWHIPLFSSGGRASSNMATIWQILYDNNADLVLEGHDHTYERFAPMRADGTLDQARGLRSFIVGTGGANHTSFTTVAANSEVRNAVTFGVLQLTLHASSYDWKFIPEAGKTFTDSGTTPCHGAVTVPTATPTSTPVATATLTPTPTNTPLLTSTPTPLPTGTPTPTSVVVATSTPTTTPPPTLTTVATATSTPPATSSLSFGPSADTLVRSDLPTNNYGSLASLGTDNSPVKNILLKFTVSGIGTRSVSSATLRLYCVDPSGFGGDFRRVADSSWGESTVNWNNAPPADATSLATLGKVVAGTWYEVDVTSLVTGDGTYSIRVISTSSDGADYSSKEGVAGQAPQLVVSAG